MTASIPEARSGHVLIVDDDRELCALLQDYLERHQLRVDSAGSAEEALARLQSGTAPDVLVLDVMLPGMDGLTALRRIRELSSMPVLMLSGRGGPLDRVEGLELGADDYLAKPALPRELLARIHALLRRAPAGAGGDLQLGMLRLQGSQRRAFLNAQALELTGAEFAVLHELLRHTGQIVSREDLTERALHRPLEKFDRAVDVHVSRLRQKLARTESAPVIESVRGAGYVLRAAAP